MPIVRADLKFYKSAFVGDSGSNGGRLSPNQIASGAAANLFDAIGDAERLAGSTKYRKVFLKAGSVSQAVADNAKIYIDKNTAAADRITFFAATQLDVQSAITGVERQYGAGALNANVNAGVSQITVLVENGAVPVFVDGDLIRISNKATLDGAGTTEFITISGAPSVLADVVTINFTPALENAYLSADTRVASVYQPGSVETSFDSLVVSSVGDGDFNSDNLVLDNIGSVEQTWTLTFTSATDFDIVGDTLGNVGSGSTGAGAAPNNTAFTRPFFTMQVAGFSGTWQTGDTIVFTTHPAAVAVWMRRVLPAGASQTDPNSATLRFGVDTSAA